MSCRCKKPSNVYNGVCGRCLMPYGGAVHGEGGVLIIKPKIKQGKETMAAFKIGSTGFVHGYAIKILDSHRWGRIWVYKVKFNSTDPHSKTTWIEYLAAKDLKDYNKPWKWS